MSDQPPTPPLPPQEPPVLSYAQAGDERPGILTAVGVLSVVIGIISTLTNLCGVSQSISYLFLRNVGSGAMVFTSTNGSATVPTTVPINPFAGMPVTPLILSAVLDLMSLSLAAYLIVCGAMVLGSRLAGRKHHLRYATLKFVLALPGALAGAWSTYSMQSSVLASVPSSGGPGGLPLLIGIALGTAGFWLIVSLAYPIAIVIVLRLRQVRAYYAKLEEVGRY